MLKTLIFACFVFAAAPRLEAAKPSDARAQTAYTAVPVPVPQSTDPRYPRGSRVVDLNSHGDVLAADCRPGILFDSAECTAVLWSMKSGAYQELFRTCPLGECTQSIFDVMLRINEHGNVGGRTDAGIVLWSQRLGLRVLGQVQPFSAYRPIVGFDDQDEIGGVAFTYPPAAYKAFFASEPTGIAYLTPAVYSVPAAMSAAGEIVGSANFSQGALGHAFYWSQKTGMVDIGALFGSATSSAVAIDKQGTVAGTHSAGSGASTMFLWQEHGGVIAEVNLPPSCGPSFLTAKDVVIGFCGTGYPNPSSVWTWSRKTGLQDMGSLGILLSVLDANSDGQVVGSRQDTTAGPAHAFVWSADAGLIDLTTGASSATAISEDGVVGGYLGDGSIGHAQAVVWVPRKP
jgi:probable HAF family extracellular repeat protein